MRLLALLALAALITPQSEGSPVVATGSPVLNAKSRQETPHIRAAVEAIRQGEAATALEVLEKALAGNPTAGPPEVVLAGLLQREGQAEPGRMALEQAAVRYPDDPEPHLALGDLAWRQRRLSDAALQYQRARELAGEMPADSPRKNKLTVWALAGLGSIAETRNQLDVAEKLYTEVLDADPQHKQVTYRLGAVLFAQGEEQKAYEQVLRAVQDQADAPPASLVMVDLANQSGKLGKAIKWAKRAAEEAPDNPAARLTLATLLFDGTSELETVRKAVAAACQAAPESRDARTLAALVAWASGDLEAAESLLEDLAIEAPNDPVANAYLASVLAERGSADQLSRAQQIATLNASTHKTSIPAATAHGWVALLADQTELAVRQLEASVNANGSDRDARYYYSRALFRSGQAGAARDQLVAALKASGRFIHRAEAERMARQLGLANNE